MTGRFSIRHNPLVVRAFRVGFRPGPTAFRFGLWATLLVLIVVGVFGFERLNPSFETKDAGRLLALLMVFYIAASFLLGGLQRMLVSFGSERQRGTFEFLHLSTLRPSSVVWGFLWAGQLPGYLLLGLSLPVMLVGALLGGLHVGYLILLVSLLAFYVLFLSVLFLEVGFWMKKASDIRGSLQAFAGIFMGLMTAASSSLPYLGILGAYPVLKSAWSRAAHVDSEVGGHAGTSVLVFGQLFAIELVAVLFLAPVGFVVARSLVRCLRNRELRSISTGGVLFLAAWLQLFTIGFLMNRRDPEFILNVLGIEALLFATWASGFSIRESWRVRQRIACSRRRAGSRSVLIDSEGPPLLLGLALSVQFGVVALGYLLYERQQGTTTLSLASALIPVSPVLLLFWLGQYFEFSRGPRVRKWLSYIVYGLFIWLPFFAALFVIAIVRQQFPEFPAERFESLQTACLVSPLAQLRAAAGYGAGLDRTGVVVTGLVQLGYLLLAGWLWFRLQFQLKRFAQQVDCGESSDPVGTGEPDAPGPDSAGPDAPEPDAPEFRDDSASITPK